MQDKHIRYGWYLALIVSVLSVLVLSERWWHAIASYEPMPGQLTDEAAVRAFLKAYPTGGNDDGGPLLIPTGVFIQSVAFVSAHDVNITGYIWQQYDAKVPKSVKRGVVFPEQVNSSSTLMSEAYRRPGRPGTGEVIGWYFDVTVRQPFDYSRYPLDRQDVWLRIWPPDFDANIVLVPDLAAYRSTERGKAFGLDQDLVPGGWVTDETYFRYGLGNYDTDFGIKNYVGQTDFPELYFDIVLSREFRDAFIVNLVPLIVVAALLFAELMMVTGDERRAERFALSTSGVIGTASALFFVVLLAHIQVRREFPGAGIVYIEYFYLAIYAAVLLVSINSYVFSRGSGPGYRLVAYADNLVPKLMFWPLLLSVLAFATWVRL